MKTLVPTLAVLTILGSSIAAQGSEYTHAWPLANSRIATKHCLDDYAMGTTCPADGIHPAHIGVDLLAAAGQTVDAAVYAPCSGVVKNVTASNGYGGIVIVECFVNGSIVTDLVGHLYPPKMVGTNNVEENIRTLTGLSSLVIPASKMPQVTVGQTVVRGETVLGYIAPREMNCVGWDLGKSMDACGYVSRGGYRGYTPHVHWLERKSSYDARTYSCGHWSYGAYPTQIRACSVADVSAMVPDYNDPEALNLPPIDGQPLPTTANTGSINDVVGEPIEVCSRHPLPDINADWRCPEAGDGPYDPNHICEQSGSSCLFFLAGFDRVTMNHRFRSYLKVDEGTYALHERTDQYSGRGPGANPRVYTWPYVLNPDTNARRYDMRTCLEGEDGTFIPSCFAFDTRVAHMSAGGSGGGGYEGDGNSTPIPSTGLSHYSLRQAKLCTTEPVWDGQGNLTCTEAISVTEGTPIWAAFQVHGTNTYSQPVISVDMYHEDAFFGSATVWNSRKAYWDGGHFAWAPLGAAVFGAVPHYRVYARQGQDIRDYVGRRDYTVATAPNTGDLSIGPSVIEIPLDVENSQTFRVNMPSGNPMMCDHHSYITPVAINALARISYLKYDPNIIPADAERVFLRLYTVEQCDRGGEFQVKNMDWNYPVCTNGVSVGDYPEPQSGVLRQYAIPGNGSWIEIELSKSGYGASFTAVNTFGSVCVGFAGPSDPDLTRRPKLIAQLPVSRSVSAIASPMPQSGETVTELNETNSWGYRYSQYLGRWESRIPHISPVWYNGRRDMYYFFDRSLVLPGAIGIELELTAVENCGTGAPFRVAPIIDADTFDRTSPAIPNESLVDRGIYSEYPMPSPGQTLRIDLPATAIGALLYYPSGRTRCVGFTGAVTPGTVGAPKLIVTY